MLGHEKVVIPNPLEPDEAKWVTSAYQIQILRNKWSVKKAWEQFAKQYKNQHKSDMMDQIVAFLRDGKMIEVKDNKQVSIE